MQILGQFWVQINSGAYCRTQMRYELFAANLSSRPGAVGCEIILLKFGSTEKATGRSFEDSLRYPGQAPTRK